MKVNIQKWGNSSAIRLPKPLLKAAGIRENEIVQVIAKANEIIIKKTENEHLTFAERMKGFAGAYKPEEIVTEPAGEEVFW